LIIKYFFKLLFCCIHIINKYLKTKKGVGGLE